MRRVARCGSLISFCRAFFACLKRPPQWHGRPVCVNNEACAGGGPQLASPSPYHPRRNTVCLGFNIRYGSKIRNHLWDLHIVYVLVLDDSHRAEMAIFLIGWETFGFIKGMDISFYLQL
ncbi:hypothetical protein J6590_056333 [Homalodisca vitripennis]|nr:hypothetical protein J6590_056331 [Homalodisca vitripennis]KAG8257076.1 hypothetical protein J6590_056333 [Homalodisca vitripennis]